jgi:hypothetical protein
MTRTNCVLGWEAAPQWNEVRSSVEMFGLAYGCGICFSRNQKSVEDFECMMENDVFSFTTMICTTG